MIFDPGHRTTVWGVAIAVALVALAYWWVAGIPGIAGGQSGQCLAEGGCYKIGFIVDPPS